MSIPDNTRSDKLLFTPGPLTTSLFVKQAMLKDLGSRDQQFIDVVKSTQKKTLAIANLADRDDYVCVMIQGSGTYGVESVIQTSTRKSEPGASNFLILENGSYGQRMANICKRMNVANQVESFAEDRAIDLARVESILNSGVTFTHVGVIHSETSSGAVNDIVGIGKLVKRFFPDATFIVDSMSGFGALPVDIEGGHIDFLVTSSNKCIQGVPGFAVVICVKSKLLECKNNSTSLSLDLYDQYANLMSTHQFRFTPPVHCILAFDRALDELVAEGGPSGRMVRYANNHRIVRDTLVGRLGFRELVPIDEQSRVINTFFYPKDVHFEFEKFYTKLSERGKVIYPGKVTKAPCFRIGNIGDLHEKDMISLCEDIEIVLNEMNVALPITN